MNKDNDMRGRKRLPLQREFTIDSLYTFHYYELPKHFVANREKHDFWEFVYVDKGEFEVKTSERRFALTQGEATFYHPLLFHEALAKQATNLIIVSFDIQSSCLTPLINQTFKLTQEERFLLTEMLKVGFEAFDPPISTFFQMYMQKNNASPFGCEHLIVLCLEMLLIKLLRRIQSIEPKPYANQLIEGGSLRNSELLDQIEAFMKSNLSGSLTLTTISEAFFTSKTRLKMLFKEAYGIGIMQYYTRLKIEQAKAMIREDACPYTEIANRLGYSDNHFFKTFKKTTGMTPTEYARSVYAKVRRTARSAT